MSRDWSVPQTKNARRDEPDEKSAVMSNQAGSGHCRTDCACREPERALVAELVAVRAERDQARTAAAELRHALNADYDLVKTWPVPFTTQQVVGLALRGSRAEAEVVRLRGVITEAMAEFDRVGWDVGKAYSILAAGVPVKETDQ